MKKAFTMLELVFVIVVVGILSYFAASSFQRNPLREAADQLVSHIRYTQHLAMQDDRFNDPSIPDSQYWYRTRWQIVFSTNDATANRQPSYSIFRNLDYDTAVDRSELAKNPLSPEKYLTGGIPGYTNLDITNDSLFAGTKELNLGTKYGITGLAWTNNCSSGSKIGFDYLGRPLQGPIRSYDSSYPSGKIISTDCNITLSYNQQNIVITIKPETGYTYISSQND
ncbi:prepilin-type N-terminal cleavage/methylation domain-containing protein [Sulfurospirillum multivorans]|uniref:Prepilin-type n-terminal cleavage/methylation signal domain-containing protein n=2 Tax=Sulfurospirillum multivorans TaxID=66821 RepID=A0AA86DYR8_SULMK|nr:prepilin-type N-terminal cleavage/methylation domain-containing protein [Sulfurospirillum multivorans]AHJ13583.1 prepilin-type n-terminal cleavage/methylation signal domain-containing protein [Sulfurospirillum multivorans DSM 12446]QEH07073.1 prepilin-type n-terminal cleavage/methylation signal domain-containing protein [Sulfurospirillum multivorans]